MINNIGYIGIILTIIGVILLGATSCKKQNNNNPNIVNITNNAITYTDWSGNWYCGGIGGDNMTLTTISTNTYIVTGSWVWNKVHPCYTNNIVTKTDIISGNTFHCTSYSITFLNPNKDNNLDSLKMYYGSNMLIYIRKP